jgi:hypothetical protein
MTANKGFKSKISSLKISFQKNYEFLLSALIAYQKNLLYSTLRKKRTGSFIVRLEFWEIAVATMKISHRSSLFEGTRRSRKQKRGVPFF